jgi:hypothetical protein
VIEGEHGLDVVFRRRLVPLALAMPDEEHLWSFPPHAFPVKIRNGPPPVASRYVIPAFFH